MGFLKQMKHLCEEVVTVSLTASLVQSKAGKVPHGVEHSMVPGISRDFCTSGLQVRGHLNFFLRWAVLSRLNLTRGELLPAAAISVVGQAASGV